MAGENQNGQRPPALGTSPKQAYDDLETGAVEAEARRPPPKKPSAEEPLASDDRPRDKSGRWVSKSTEPQPGEAIEPLDPAPKKPIEDQKPTD